MLFFPFRLLSTCTISSVHTYPPHIPSSTVLEHSIPSMLFITLSWHSQKSRYLCFHSLHYKRVLAFRPKPPSVVKHLLSCLILILCFQIRLTLSRWKEFKALHQKIKEEQVSSVSVGGGVYMGEVVLRMCVCREEG